MAKRKSWGDLSPRAKQRAYAAGARYELTHRQVSRRYNAGTYNPFARANPELRVPAELRSAAGVGAGGQIEIDWEQAAYNNYHRLLGPGSPKGESYKYNASTVRANVEYASHAVREIMAFATESELRAWGRPQPDANGEPPPLEAWDALPPYIRLEEIGFRDSGGSWNNIFWYH